jgi:uncharacterized membrane protein
MKIGLNSKLIITFLKFIIPILIGIAVVLTVGYFLDDYLRLRYWSLITAYFFPPFGKETVIPAGIVAGIHPTTIALSIAFVDIIVALFLVYNYDLAKKIPFVGKFIVRIEKIGRSSSDKYRWLKPLRFIGIILFVMVPFQGSGGLVGSIVGRLIGMKRWTVFIAISIGAIVGCLLIGYFADAILSVLVKNLLLGVMILIIILVIGIMIFISKKTKKMMTDQKNIN